jgi:hypothetical protein
MAVQISRRSPATTTGDQHYAVKNNSKYRRQFRVRAFDV